MDARIRELVDFTKVKVGLDNYYLERYSIDRNVNISNDTIYTLSMEWFPEHVSGPEDDDSNPEGTAVIELDVNTRRFASVIFVGGKSFANGMMFNDFDKRDMIKWIEQETGLTYEQQFQLKKEENGEFDFRAYIDSIAVYPPGSIEVKFDPAGKLTFFAVHGPFPSKKAVRKETYTLSLAKTEHLAKQQLKLIEFPSDEQERLFSVYAVEEIFVTNEQMTTIPFEFIADERPQFPINKTVYWNTSVNKPFDREEIQFIEDVTAEQAFSCEPSPASFPITQDEQEKCMMGVRDLLRQEYPDDTGRWILKTLNRDKGYIHATLRVNEQDERVFRRKLTIIIDAKSLQAINYVDNKPMLEMFDSLQPPEKTTIAKKVAYEKLKALMELDPYYVYDFKQNQYVLCGKLDCHYGVNASNGEVIALDDL